MSVVIQSLRQKLSSKAQRDVMTGNIKKWSGEASFDAGSYRPEAKVSLERARLLTESYKETEGQPMVIRRAKALEKILQNMTVYIGEGERIVGVASLPGHFPLFPELYHRWVDKALNDGYRYLLDETEREEWKKIRNYWVGKAIDDRARAQAPISLQQFIGFSGAFQWVHAWTYCSANYEKLFNKGLHGLIKEAEGKLGHLKEDMNIPATEYIEQINFLEAVIIVLKAVIEFARRYGQKARELAIVEEESSRKAALEEIAKICDWVPGNPPRSLHEALQSFWFVHLVAVGIETPGNGVGMRFDQVVYPFYLRDKHKGMITREQAQDLVEFLWIKFEELGTHLSPPTVGAHYAGGHINQLLTLGGVTPKGEDATNEMSYIMLDASREMRLLQPSLALRYHDGIPDKLVYKAIDTIRTGIGYPAFFNDKSMIPHFLVLGAPLEDARNYALIVCVQPYIPGKNIQTRCSGGKLCLPKFLELALNQGIDKFTGKQLGYPTPDPATFTSVSDVMDAYLKQVNFFMDKMLKLYTLFNSLYREYIPRPYASALLDGCIERGKEEGAWAYVTGPRVINWCGPTNVADSLAAMKKLVFEERKITMEELLEALKTNFEGKERLRQMLINDAPKFGNDDEYVDSLAAEVHKRTFEEIAKFKDEFSRPVISDGSGTAGNFGLAVATGATPDGRKDGDPYADAVLSPSLGRDFKGPTAVLKSASKVDPVLYSYLLNQKFLPQHLEGENIKLFAQYLKTWADLGISHIQFNVFDEATLLDAQQHPEKYTNLVIRVAGYSAYFTDLSRNLQDLIIARTKQGL